MKADIDGTTQKYLEGLSVENLSKLEESVDTVGSVKIGSGSLGDVILVRERATNRKLAIKVISLKRLRQSGTSEARVRREVEVMRELNHPHIVRLVGVTLCENRLTNVGSDPPYICILMEYVRNSEPLSNVLRRAGPQPSRSLQVVWQLASALALIHQRGIVHRDIWSENVLVDGNGTVVLVDLGNAEFFDRVSEGASEHMNLPYLSPQCAQGDKQQPGDDCWALGILITELVTGRFVVDRTGRTDVPLHFRRAAFLDAVNETVVRGGLLGKICVQLLELDVKRRMTMVEVLREFKEAMGHKPGDAVMYIPRSHNVPHQSVVIGRLPGRDAWQIKLPNGNVKDVDDAEAWRIIPISLGGVPDLAAAQKPQLSHILVPQTSEHTSQRPKSPMQSAQPQPPRQLSPHPQRMPQQPLHHATAPSPSAPGIVPSRLPACAPSLTTVYGTSSVPPTPAPHSTSVALCKGQVVMYIAKTDNRAYRGVIVGRTGPAWTVNLECGLAKEVSDADAWRLIPT